MSYTRLVSVGVLAYEINASEGDDSVIDSLAVS